MEKVNSGQLQATFVKTNGEPKILSAEYMKKELDEQIQCLKQPWTGDGVSLRSGYHIQDRDLPKIHKAACRGDVSEVKRLLSRHPERLNDRDKQKRTALHLACAFGRLEVVTLLAEKKCQMNVGDNRNKTALMKAVESQEEECATILLKHGADPHMKDFLSNTALHYAAMGHNTAIAEQLLQHQADMEATNEFDFTPLLFAVHRKSQEMVEFLLERHANIHAVDKWKRTALMLAVWAKSSNIVRLLLQAGADVFAQDDIGFTAEEYALSKGLKDDAKLISDCEKERRWKKSSDNNSRVDECSTCNNARSVSRETCKNDSWSVSAERLVDVDTKPTIEEKDPVPDEAVGMDEVQPFRPDSSSWNATSLTFNHGTSQRSGDSKFGDKRPFATHSRSKPLSASTEFGQMTVIDKRKTQIGVDECSKCDPASSLSRETGNNDSWPISEEWLFDVNTKKEATKPAIGKRENRVAIIESAPQDQTNNDNLTCVDSAHQDNIRVKKSSLGLGQDEDEESPWDSETSIEVEDPVPEEAVGKYGAQPCRPASSKWNATSLTFDHGTSQRSGDWKVGDKRPFASHSMSKPLSASTEFGQMTVIDKRKSQIVGQHLGMTSEEGQARLDGNEKNYTRVVQKENDTQRPLSQEQDNRILEDAILTNCLQQQKETKINLKKMNSEVSESYEKEKDLLRENQMLRDEIAILRLQLDTLKPQNQEMEKKYFEDTANVKQKDDRLQKTIKLNDKTLTKTVFEYNRQLNVPTAENTMLNSQLENESRSKERLKIEAESDLYMLASASLHHYELCKQLIRHLRNALQGLRDECLHFMDKIRFARCNLKENTEILFQQLSKAQSKSNSLDTELPHTRYAVRDRTLVFEPVLKDPNQTQCQEEKIEHVHQRKQGKVSTYTGEPDSPKEKGSDLQSGKMLLPRQLGDAFNKSDNKENSGMNIQEQLQQLKKALQAVFEKQDRMLKEEHQDFVNKLNHLNGRMCQYKKDKSEREVVGRQLQRELPDTIKKLPKSEASLQVRSHQHMNSEAETQDFKTLEQLPSQQQEASARHAEDAQCTKKIQDHVQRLETQNAVIKTINKKLEGIIEHLHRNLSGTSLSQDGKKQLEYYKKLTESLQYDLNQQKKTNDGLEKEVTRLKTLFQNTRMLHDNQNGEEQAACQENVDPLNDRGDRIQRLQVRIQRLESELSKAKHFKIELEECKRLYLEELKVTASLEKKLNKIKDTLAEMRTQLLMNAPENSLLSMAPRRPDLHLPCVGRLNDWFRPRGNLAPREQLVIATSAPQTSNNGTCTNLMKEQQKLVESITRDVEEADAELQSEHRLLCFNI